MNRPAVSLSYVKQSDIENTSPIVSPRNIEVNLEPDTPPIFEKDSNTLFRKILGMTNSLIPLTLFFGLYIAILFILLFYIQSKLPDSVFPWFFKGQPISFGEYFYFVVNTLAQTNINGCGVYSNVPYCISGNSNIKTISTISGEHIKNFKENIVSVTQTIDQYVKKQIETGGKAPLPATSTRDPEATNIPTLPSIPDIPKIPELENLKYQIDAKNLYFLSDIKDLGITIKNKIMSDVPKPYRLTIIVFAYFFFISAILYIFYLFSKALRIDPNVRIITIWEDRNDFLFSGIFLFYVVLFLFIYVILKSQASRNSPFLFPFPSTYIDPKAFRSFKNKQSQMISTIRLSNPYQNVPKGNVKYSLEPFETKDSIADTETKLKHILESRTETKVKNGVDLITTKVINGIEWVQRTIQSLILRTYLSKENTIKRVLPR